MKRSIALVIVFALVVSMSSSLAGCGQVNDLQMGTWLSLIADSFGMSEYTSAEPYFAKVGSEDIYFGAFQLAAEWEILAPDNNVSSETDVLWKDALITLVNAGAFLSSDATDEEKIDFAIDNFDPNIRTYWMNRNISLKEAVALLDVATDMWVNKTYTEKVEEWQMAEGVTDLIQTEDLEYTQDGNTVVIDASAVKGLAAGDVYTLPGIAGVAASSVNRIESIEFYGDKAIITNDETFGEEDIPEVLHDVKIQDTSSVDFSELSAIYDANGNVLFSASEGVNPELAEMSYDEYEGVYVSNLMNTPSDSVRATNLGGMDFSKSGIALSFEVSGIKVKLSVSKNSIGISMSEEQWKKDSKLRDAKVTFSSGVTLKDISLTKDVDFSWGKLNYASLRMNYTTVLSGGIKYSETSKVGTNIDGDEYKSIQGLTSLINKYEDALHALSRDVYDTKYDDKTVYICRIAIPGASTGIAGLDFIVTGKISVTGQVQIQLTVNGTAGMEYKNGNVRTIKSTNQNLDVAAEATAEVTISTGVELAVLTYTVAQLTAEAGIGGQFKATMHLVDEEFHLINSSQANIAMDAADNLETLKQMTSAEDILALAVSEGGTWNGYVEGGTVSLSTKVCVDWTVYPILRINFNLYMPKNISSSIEISGSKNTKFKLTGHIHFPNNIVNALKSGSIAKGFSSAFGLNEKCSYDFTPWDMEKIMESMVEEYIEDNSLEVTSGIKISSQRVFLNKGTSQKIEILGLPEGYSPGDLVVEVADTSIATFNVKEGCVYAGKQAGTTMITIKTSDAKYQTVMAITVEDDQVVDFVGLSGGKKA